MSIEKEIAVYVIDAGYEIVGSEPHIIIWGIDENGKRIILRDKRFSPYFYAIIDQTFYDRIDVLKNSIKRLSKIKSPITSIDIVNKKYIGKDVKALKIRTVLPESVKEYREEIAKIPGIKAVVEADIRFTMRYLIDNRIYPCTWHLFKVVERNKSESFRVDAEYEVIGIGERIERILPPEMKILAFDIEVYNPQGTPKPNRDPIIIISIVTSNKDFKILKAREKDDRHLIKDFIDYIQNYDPDIIVGYNSNRFDWPYLLQRSRYLGIKLDVSRRKGVEPTQSVHGHISIPGRLNIDLYDFAEEIAEIKVKSLDEVAEFLGVMKKKERVNIPWYEIYKYWDNKELQTMLLKYAEDDAISTYGIAEKILPFAIQLSSITGLPLDQVGAASVGFRLEWFLIRIAYENGEIVPNRVEREYEPYKGAIVLEPKRGVHENIAVLDFSSMYPSIMIKYNIGPDTLARNSNICENIECFEAPETGYRFVKTPPAFFKTALETLIKARKAVREQMKSFDSNTIEFKILDARQKALKILANACYGYMAWTGARWYCRECAEAVTDYGRESIKMAIELANKLGLEIIYGDTDSIFIKYDKNKIEMFIDLVEKMLGLEIKVDKIYSRVFFTEAKKRYIGVAIDGRIDVVGFEAVRGDWAEIAKEIQEKIAEIILRTMDHRKAIEAVRNEIEMLRKNIENRSIDINKFIIWKTISKPLSEYEVEAPHITAAKQLIRMGYSIDIGDKIGYIIVKGSGKISERARPYIAVDIKDIDIDYYIEHQILPSVIRILSYFGVTEKHLKGIGKTSRSLFDYSKY